jgi:hypothetical protein
MQLLLILGFPPVETPWSCSRCSKSTSTLVVAVAVAVNVNVS